MTREELLAITQAIKEGFQSSGGRTSSVGPTGGATGGATRTLLTKEEYEKELKLIKEIYEGEEELTELRRLIGTQLEDQKNQIEDALKAEIRRGNTTGELYEKYKKDLKQVNDLIKQTKKDLEAVAASDALPTLEDGFKKLGKASLDFFANVTKPVQLTGIIDYAKKIDSLGASFAKTTGAGRKYLFEARQLQQNLQNIGATTEDTMKSFTDLSMGLTNFTNESIAAQTEIAKTATILDKLGQPAAATAKNVSTLKAVLGESNESALELQESLGNAAFTLGMSVNEINEKFISNLNRLSIYGSGAKDQFVRLQTFASATKMEVSSLVDLTERLSTFEGSAEFAGRLNAITGKDLFDVTQLTMLEGQDKIDYIVERLQGAGFDLDDPKMMRVVQQASGMDANTFRSMINASGARIAAVGAKVSDKMAEGSSGLAKNAEMSATNQEKIASSVEALQSRVADFTNALENYDKASRMIAESIKQTSGGAGTGIGIAGMLASLLAGGVVGKYLETTIKGFFAKRRLEKNMGVEGAADGEGAAGEEKKGITDIAKDVLGKKEECIAICKDSLEELADMIGGGGGGGFGGGEGGGGRRRKRGRGGKRGQKGKPSAKSQRKAQRKVAARKEAMRRKRGGGGKGAGLMALASAGLDIATGDADLSTVADVAGSVGDILPTAGKAGGFLNKVGGFFGKLNPMNAVKGLFKDKSMVGKLLKGLGKYGGMIGTILSVGLEINDLIKAGKQPGITNAEFGTQMIEAIASLGGGLLGGVAGSFIPIPGVGTFLGSMLGSLAGPPLARFLIDKGLINPEPFGKIALEAIGDEKMGTGPTQPNMAGDMYSSGDRFYVGPEGTYQFSEKDFFTAGTRDSYGNMGGSSKEEMALLKEQNTLLRMMAESMARRTDPLFVNGFGEFSSRSQKTFG